MMLLSLLNDYWASVAAFTVFAVLHSVGAREPFKDALARRVGPFFVEHFWRFLYCAVSYAALYYGISSLHWSRNPAYDVWLVLYPDWLWTILTVLHLGSVVLMYVAFLQSDYLEFLGFKQAWRGILAWLGKAPSGAPLELFGTDRLETRGVYAWVRHPMLSAGLLFLLTSGPSLNNLMFTAMYLTYMLIGGYYEEKRLVRIFGEEYRRYRRRSGAYFPRLRRAVSG